MRFSSPHVLQVYLAGPITDADPEDVWRHELRTHLRFKYGIVAVLPQAGALYTEHLGIENPAPVLTQRDKWMCQQSDVVLANFTGSEKASIGTCIEIGWASLANVPIIAVLEKGNVHDHAMITSLVNFRVDTLEEAVPILRGLQGWDGYSGQ